MKIFTFKRVLIGLFLFYALVGFTLLPFLITSKVPSLVENATGAHFKIEDASFNPFIFELKLKGLAFNDPDDKKLAALKQIKIDIDPSALFLGRIKINTIELTEPDLDITQKEPGVFNFNWLLVSAEQEETPSADEQSTSLADLPRIVIDNISIINGEIAYHDLTRPTPFNIKVGPIGFSLKELDTRDINNSDNNVRLYLKLYDGGFLDIKSEFLSLEPLALQGSVDFEAGKLYTPWQYLQDDIELEVADGRLSLHLNYQLDTADINTTRIDNVHFALEKLRIKPKSENDDLLRIGSLTLDNGVIEPFKNSIALKDIRLNDVMVYAKREKNGSIDWMRHIAADDRNTTTDDKGENGQKPAPWLVTLESFEAEKIGAQFADKAIKPHTIFVLNDFNLSATDITSLPSSPLHYRLGMKINGKMLCSGDGLVAHSPLDTNGSFGCEEIDITWANPYINEAADAALKHFDLGLESASAGIGIDYKAHETNGTLDVSVTDGNLHIKEILLRQKSSGKKLFALDKIDVNGIEADTARQSALIKTFLIDKPLISVTRNQYGKIDWSEAVKPKDDDPAVEKTASKKKPDSKKPWVFALDQFNIKGGGILFEDLSPGVSATTEVDHMNIQIDNINSEPKSVLTYNTSMRINKKGVLKVSGDLKRMPLESRSKIALSGFDLKDYNAYLAESTFLKIDRGVLDLKSSVSYLDASPSPAIEAKGDINIQDFILQDTHDKSLLAAWKELSINPFIFKGAPNSLLVDEVLLDSLYVNAVVDRNQSFNFARLVKEDNSTVKTSSSEQNQSKTEPLVLRIVKFSIKNSNANFADFSLPLQFQTSIHDINGTVYGVSNQPEQTSYINVSGAVDQYGSAKIEGSLNSADPKSYTDIGLAFRNIDLSSVSPYSGKFVGRKIDKGKLFVELEYDLLNSQMHGENSLVIKKLSLGENIESNESAPLPLDLAIALLEDSDGVIDIDMPVEGNVDNPDFKWGGVVWGAFANLITKAVSAPFSLLGSMLGIDGEQLEYIEFEPGMATILPPEREKLDLLGKALKKRPKLALGVVGTYDEKLDRNALKKQKLLALASEKNSKKTTGSDKAMSVETLERLHLRLLPGISLGKVKKEVRKKAGDDKNFPLEYQKTLARNLLEVQNVTEQELLTLSKTRAKNITAYLNISRGIDKKRIAAQTKKSDGSEDGEWVRSQLAIEVAKE